MPVDRGAIDAQLREIGEGDRWWEHREFRELPHILHPDEQIRGVARGRLIPWRLPRVIRPGARWLLVATDLRLICLKQQRYARRQVEIAAGEFLRVRTSSRLRGYQVLIETPHRTYRILIAKEDAFRFTRAIAPLMPQTTVQWLDGDAAVPARLPGQSGLAALPGVGRMVARLGPGATPEYATREAMERLELTTERLQGEIERLQQQVAFLEDLLQKRAEEAAGIRE